ncbi:MAG TPA: hypothetical protein VLZ83_11535 [Edaphocola sp.]|nr:hypothetical protein [Edaphocola sp.]
MNVLQSNSAGDVSLESIAVMAQAQNGENSSNCITRDHQCYTYANGVKGCFPLSEQGGGDCNHCTCKQ